jgi:signal transduction histidine kinase
MKCPVARRVSCTLGTVLVLLGLIGVFTYRSTTRLAANADWVAHVHRVLGEMDEVMRGLDEAASSRCGFTLTGADDRRLAYEQKRGLIAPHFAELRQLMDDSPTQQRRLDEAERLSQHLLDLLDRSIQLRQRNRFDVKGQWALTQEWEQGLKSLRVVFAQVKEEGNTQLAAWDADARASARDTILMLDAGNFLMFAAVGVGLVTIRRGLQTRPLPGTSNPEEQADRCRLLEEQIRRAQRMSLFGRLVSGVVHDCNNLINVVLTTCHAALHRLRPDDPVRELIHLLRQAAERMAGLTRQLLTFSRGRRGSVGPVDVNAAITEIEPIARCLLGREIEWVVSLTPGLPKVSADRDQVDQVLLNLIANARDAMAGVGHLYVETTAARCEEIPGADPDRAWVRLTVSDSGCGMDEATRAHLFEPFFTTKAEGRGSGLGMAIIQDIMQGHGGHIRVDSELGKGTSVRVYLPATEAAVLEIGRNRTGGVPETGSGVS